MCKKAAFVAFFSMILLISTHLRAAPKAKGIYVNQSTLENTSYLKYLIQESKFVGINTFIVDLQKVTKNYQKNIQLVKDNGLKYVARIVVFPDGGRAHQIKSSSYLESKFKLIDSAIRFGANEIQLDYIRYSTKQPPSQQNAKDIKEVIRWFKKKTDAHDIPLQVDIFGEVTFKESPHIGQNIKLFADTIDAACPMVYPSHYNPYQEHSRQPYKTVYTSLVALKKQFNGAPPFRVTPFIEASNYHYRMSSSQKSEYVLSQIRAVEDANADGWYVWSAQNKYNHLFTALKQRRFSQ